MRDIDDPETSDAVPITAFYADRVSFFVEGDICRVVDFHHDLVPFVYVCQSLSGGVGSIHPPNIAPVRVGVQTQKYLPGGLNLALRVKSDQKLKRTHRVRLSQEP